MDFDEVKHLIEEFFNGKFEVKKFLGEGSFAKVYLVNHNYLDALMAMKIIKEPLSATTNKKDVFREVTIACQIRHENIISIYDAAEINNFEDGKSHAYFVMEYVSGGDLEHFLNSYVEINMFMPISLCLDLMEQILSGLNTLHSANPPVIHRDLKTNNVLLSFNACGDIVIKISDFGFAKEVTTTISDIDIAGTRPYMAPELFNKSVSTRSDIYAVGVMFYQLLTNRYPYNVGDYTNEELVELKPWKKDLKPPSHYNPQVSDLLDEIVLKSLDVNPNNRYGDASEMLVDVKKAIDEHDSAQSIPSANTKDNYNDDYCEYIINDSIKEAFRLAKCENKLNDAIEILEGEVLENYAIRKFYSETLRIWKSKRPDLKLISKAFTVNLKGRHYKLSCNFLKEAIAYNPSLKSKYQHYIDLWEIFIDLERHGSLYKAVVLLEKLMDSNREIKKLYKDILPTLKTYSVDEIIIEAIRLVNLNDLSSAANLMEFAVVMDDQVRKEYAYKLSLWKQNMKMHFKHSSKIKEDTVDYAIDLGTTDSVISYFNNGNPIIIKNHRTGEDFTPSAVLVDEADTVEVGVSAKDAILKNDSNAVTEFKHNMGFSIPFKFEKSSRVMFPEELSAEVLKDLRVSVYDETGVNIEHAVICVPANSNPIKTKAVNDAADLAGFRSHSLILEPIAVSLAYNLHKTNGIWMIYDLGGGTFNVSLIRDNKGELEKLATDGLENLGGNAFDWKIVDDLFRPKIAYDLNLDDFRRGNPKYVEVFARLKNAAEISKINLSKMGKTDICISNLFDDYDFRYTLTRYKFKEIIDPLIEYTFNVVRNLLEEYSVSEEDIDKIILVGGSSISPIVQSMIKKEFSCEIESSLNPLTVVSKGAAIYAGSLEKPHIDIKKEPLSVLLKHKNGVLKGKVFSNDLKSSFLGYDIEIASERVPLKIDGTFKLENPPQKYDIAIWDNENPVELDAKSPDCVDGEMIFIPYLNKEFDINADSQFKELMNRYSKLLKEIDYLSEYSLINECEIQKYIETLLEISQRDKIALNQTEIYIDYLTGIVEDAKRNLEHSMILENVAGKIDVVKNNGLFEIGDRGNDLEKCDLDELRDIHASLVEEYVSLNRDDVIIDCFFNLKLEGVYTNNEKLADELIENAQLALNLKDYEELLSIVNVLYELDEREGK
ncbi:Hsp70 family protein [Methanobrevibacter sp.]|uniref:Hsp70 family protein n=1 Tax=Methanobrevibacter sp. TaxID=66852 RepID=UPI00386EBC09